MDSLKGSCEEEFENFSLMMTVNRKQSQPSPSDLHLYMNGYISTKRQSADQYPSEANKCIQLACTDDLIFSFMF